MQPDHEPRAVAELVGQADPQSSDVLQVERGVQTTAAAHGTASSTTSRPVAASAKNATSAVR